jgi:hypothetical protein
MMKLIKRMEELEALENSRTRWNSAWKTFTQSSLLRTTMVDYLMGFAVNSGHCSDLSLREAVGKTPIGKRVPKGTPPEAHD